MKLGQHHICLSCCYSSQAHTSTTGKQTVGLDVPCFMEKQLLWIQMLLMWEDQHQLSCSTVQTPDWWSSSLFHTRTWHHPLISPSPHCSAQQQWRDKGHLGGGLESGVGRELLTARAGTWPPVTQPQQGAAQPVPDLIPHKPVLSNMNRAGFCKAPTHMGRTVPARAGERRKNMGSGFQCDQGRKVKMQAQGLMANAAP